MALKDVLFRCPVCGHGPTHGRKDHVHCPSCERHFLRGPAPARIEVKGPDGERTVSARELVKGVTRRVEPVSGKSPGAGGGDGGAESEAARAPEARVRVRWGVDEDIVRFRGELLGFTERLGPPSEMRLRLLRRALELWNSEERRRRWNLLDLRAVQPSSSSLQIYTVADELVHFRFLDDSAFRWEGLLHETLRAVYREAGKGEIVEFQPRISVR